MAFNHLTKVQSLPEVKPDREDDLIRYRLHILRFYRDSDFDQNFLHLYQPYYIFYLHPTSISDARLSIEEAYNQEKLRDNLHWRTAILWQVWLDGHTPSPQFLDIKPAPLRYTFAWVILRKSVVRYGCHKTVQLYDMSGSIYIDLNLCAKEGLLMYKGYDNLPQSSYRLYVYGKPLEDSLTQSDIET